MLVKLRNFLASLLARGHEKKESHKRESYATIEKEIAEQGTLLPPWLKFPEIQRYSMGWRMGAGEHYLRIWYHWANSMDQSRLIQYFRQWAPIPIPWLDWTANAMGYSHENIKIGVKALIELGIAEDFEAFKAWYDAVWE